MEGILRGISHICIYLNDILITGESPKEQMEVPGHGAKTVGRDWTALEEEEMQVYAQVCRILGAQYICRWTSPYKTEGSYHHRCTTTP